MAASRKIIELFDGMGENLQRWVTENPRSFYESLRWKFHHLPQVNFDLGIKFAAENKLSDAIFRFRLATYFQPDFLRAHYNLGCCYVRAGKYPQAKAAFLKVLALDPAHMETLFMLSALDPASVPPSQRPTRMPAGAVHDFFNPIASNYDAIEMGNQYQGGKICADLLKPLLSHEPTLRVTDLGCGTGIAVRGLRASATHIAGIDFCSAMVQMAQQVKSGDLLLFDAVFENDLQELSPSNVLLTDSDILVCCNVMQFLGNPAPFLPNVGAAMKPGAHLLLSFEPYNVADGFGVNLQTGRFGHHPDAIKQLAAAAKLAVVQDTRAQLYPGMPPVNLLLLKKVA